MGAGVKHGGVKSPAGLAGRTSWTFGARLAAGLAQLELWWTGSVMLAAVINALEGALPYIPERTTYDAVTYRE